jgi:hypothetical protein
MGHIDVNWELSQDPDAKLKASSPGKKHRWKAAKGQLKQKRKEMDKGKISFYSCGNQNT